MSIMRKQFYNPEVSLVKVIEQTDSYTKIRMLPTPFGGPNKKDFHGQYFDSETYFGDDVVQVKFGLYEHFMNDLSNPAMAKMGKQAQILGPATLVKNEDSGDANRWFDIEVSRSLEYHDVLIDLVQKGLMGSSTQAFMNSVDVEKDGRIKTWIENEVSLTPTPANKDTIGKVYEVVKAYKDLPSQFGVVKNDQLVVLDDNSVVELVKEDEDVPEVDFVNELDSVLEGGEDTPGDESQTILPDGLEVSDDMKAALKPLIEEVVKAQVSVMVDLWGQDFEEIRDILSQMMGKSLDSGVTKELKAVRTEIDGLKKGFLHFAKWSKAAVTSRVGAEYEEFSTAEREVLLELESKSSPPPVESNSVIPSGAPGARNQ